jgi:hypothetical protein
VINYVEISVGEKMAECPPNSELMRDNMSLKKGIISAMINASTHVTAMIPLQTNQPLTVLL